MSLADVWIIRPAEMPHWAAAGLLLTLPEKLAERGDAFDWNGLLSLYREQLLTWDKKTFALPLVGESAVCLYRQDLFADPAVQTAFRGWLAKRGEKTATDLRAPASWDEFALLAEFFRDHRSAPSLPPLPADPLALDRLFYQVASSYVRRAVRQDEEQGPDHLAEVFAFHYDLKSALPRLDTPGFVAALKLLARLQACRPAGSSPTPDAAFLEGKAVLALTDASTILEAQKRPELTDRLGLAPIPGSTTFFSPTGEPRRPREGVNRVPYLGGAGWIGVVPTTSRSPEAAWDLLVELAGSARSLQIASEPRFGGGATRGEHLIRDRWDSFGLSVSRSLALKDLIGRHVASHGLKNPVLVLRIPDQQSHRIALDEAVRRALLEKADPLVSLQGVVTRWKALDAAQGREKLLRNYRLSLGLSPN